MTWVHAAARCPRVPDKARPADGLCAYCAKPLPRRKDGGIHLGRTSCSGECAQAFGREHDWKLARARAVERDGGKCVTCGVGPGIAPPIRHRPTMMFDRSHWFPRTDRPWPNHHVWLPEHGPQEAHDAAHEHDYNLHRQERNAYKARAAEFAATHRQLEVNHIEPRVGAGYGTGCWNHLDNLETLCHPCHVEVTKAQGRARREAAQPQQRLEIA